MLQDFREKIQGSLAKIIIVLICIPFAFFGVESFFSGGGNNDVAEVGAVSISQSELDEAVFLRKRQMINQMGENVDYTLLEDAKLRQPSLDSLVDTQVLVNAAKKLGLEISDEQVFDQIIKDPNFQVDGKFSNDRFRFIVKQAGLSEEIYIRLSKNEFLIQQLYSGFIGAEFLTKKDVELYAELSNETRDITLIRLSLDDAKMKVVVTEQEIIDYYEKNKESFKTNETVVIDYLTIKKADYIKPVGEKALKQAYDDEAARYIAHDSYKLSHIQVSMDESEEAAREKIEVIQKKLAAGERFFELAENFSDDLGTRNKGGSLGVGTASLFPKEFIAAVKSLKKGEVSSVIDMGSALHLVKLVDVTKDVPPSFTERRGALKNELALANAEPAFRNAEETLKDISFNSPDLSEPAKSLGAVVETTLPLTRNEVRKLFKNPQLVQAIFSDEVLLDRLNSDVYEVSDDEFTSARVKRHNLSSVMELESVKKQIKASILMEKARDLLAEQLASLKTEIVSSHDTPKVLANRDGYLYKKQDNVKRNSFNLFERNVIESAFKLPQVNNANEMAVSTASLSNGDMALLLVNNVKAGSGVDLKESERRSLALILSQSKGNNLFEGYQSYLKKNTKIKFH